MRFTKMHGLGNDYVYVNGFVEDITDPPAVARAVSDRHFGIGGDGEVEFILGFDVTDDLQVNRGDAGAAFRQLGTGAEGGDDNPIVGQGRRVVVGGFRKSRGLTAFDAHDLDRSFVVTP